MNRMILAAALCLAASLPTLAAAPKVTAGLGYYAILPDKILLVGQTDPGATCAWEKVSGPGDVVFERPASPTTWATATQPGAYVFRLRASAGGESAESQTKVNVHPAGTYGGNPILPGMFPDPHVMADGDMFYIYATSMENDAGSYGRASVWMSRDFVNWKMKLTNWPVYGQFGGDIWAPDIAKWQGKYYQFITRSGGYDTWIAVADSPTGPWKNLREDNTPIVSGGGKAGRIVPAYNMDAQPFFDDDGQAYMYWGWAESMGAKLTPDLKNIDGPVHFLKGTKWLPADGKLPQWLTVQLHDPLPITRVRVMPEFRHVAYGYTVEVSNDGQTWQHFSSRLPTTPAGEGYVDTGSATGRFVRITMTDCGGHWAGLYSFEVYVGDQIVSRNAMVTASSMRGKGAEPANAIDVSDGPNLDDYVEGSYMIKHKDTYYLLYSSGALHDGTYSVHYAMAKKPFGPFVKPKDNIVLKQNEEQTTRGPGHNSVLLFEGQHYIVYHQHNQPHEDGALVYRQTCVDRLDFNDDGTIRRVTPTQTGIPALRKPEPQGTDLAQGKYATATSVRGVNYMPEYALDRNNASKWRAATNDYPQTLTVDLGGASKIGRVETSFEHPTLAYTYRIETSPDGTAWQPYADHTAAFPTEVVSPMVDAAPATAQFIRVTITGCQRPENGAGIYAFRVFAP